MKTVKPISKTKQCIYKYYDKDTNSLKECGIDAVVLYGSLPLCKNCATFVLSQDKSCRHIDSNGKIIKSVLDII